MDEALKIDKKTFQRIEEIALRYFNEQRKPHVGLAWMLAIREYLNKFPRNREFDVNVTEGELR